MVEAGGVEAPGHVDNKQVIDFMTPRTPLNPPFPATLARFGTVEARRIGVVGFSGGLERGAPGSSTTHRTRENRSRMPTPKASTGGYGKSAENAIGLWNLADARKK